MFHINIDQFDVEGLRIFAKAMQEYADFQAGETRPKIEEPFERVPPKSSIEQAAESMKDPLGGGKVTTYSESKGETKPITVTEEKPDTAKAFKGEEAPASDNAELDERGVAFNEEYCGRAAEPFYTSGTRQGQWKKRRGLDQKAYDAWYTGELLKLKPTAAEQPAAKPEAQATPETTKAAFSGTDSTPPTPPAGDDTDHDEPTSAGELMGWVAEMQAAERLDQDGIDRAYNDSGFTPGDLFSGKEGAVKGLYDAMKVNLK